MELKDSGNRREFSSGAVRDINEGKGRCDLLPLGVLADICDNKVFSYVNEYIRTGDKMLLVEKSCVVRYYNGTPYLEQL